MRREIQDKDLRISQTPGAIFELTDEGVLEMRGHLPDWFLRQLHLSGAWKQINATTYGLYYARWWFRSHNTFRIEYNDNLLQVSVGDDRTHRTMGYKVPENELTVEVILAELWTLSQQVIAYLRENPSRGRDGVYASVNDDSAD